MAERLRTLQCCGEVSPSMPGLCAQTRHRAVAVQKCWARPAQHWNWNHSKARCLTLWDVDPLILVTIRNLRIRSLFSLKHYLVLCFLFLWSFLRRWKHVFKKLFEFNFLIFKNFQLSQQNGEWGWGCIARPINRVIIRWPWAAPCGAGHSPPEAASGSQAGVHCCLLPLRGVAVPLVLCPVHSSLVLLLLSYCFKSQHAF